MTMSRRPKLSRDQLFELFVEEGREILRTEGLGSIGEVLTFRRVADQVEDAVGIRIARGSIIGRVWPTLVDYQTDVLVAIAADEGNAEMEEVTAHLISLATTIDTSSVEARWSGLREMRRVGAAASIDALSRSHDWSLWIGVWAITAVGTAPERHRKVECALRQSYLSATDRMAGAYEMVNKLVGFRPRPGLTVRQYAIAVAALAEGCVLRNRVDAAQMTGIWRSSGPNKQPTEWTLFGLAVDALGQAFFEPDPDWLPVPHGAPSASVK